MPQRHHRVSILHNSLRRIPLAETLVRAPDLPVWDKIICQLGIRSKRQLYFGWFGGVQIFSKGEEL